MRRGFSFDELLKHQKREVRTLIYSEFKYIHAEVLEQLGFSMGEIVGIMEGNSNPEVFIPQLVDFHMQGKFPFDRLIRFYPFDDIEQAFHDSEAGTTIKPVLRMT